MLGFIVFSQYAIYTLHCFKIIITRHHVVHAMRYCYNKSVHLSVRPTPALCLNGHIVILFDSLVESIILLFEHTDVTKFQRILLHVKCTGVGELCNYCFFFISEMLRHWTIVTMDH